MDKYHRSVVHDVAEIAGLVTYSVGEEDVDRHIQVWKKEVSPCEGELAALRRGDEWDPVKEDVDRHIQVWKKEFSPCEGELAALRRGDEWDPVKEKLEKEEREWTEKLEVERSRTLNKVTPR